MIARLGLADNGMPPCRMTNLVYRDSDDSGFFSIEFGWSRLSDNAVILQSGLLVPYDLTAFTGLRVRVGIFSSKQVDNGVRDDSLARSEAALCAGVHQHRHVHDYGLG